VLLAIDASTNWASLALVDGDAVRATRSWQIGQQHSVQIFGEIEQLFAYGEAQRSDITAIGVAIGPGSFNGVRVAVTVAKTLAFVWNVPIAGVPTLDALAQAQRRESDEDCAILSVLEAGRDELYIGWYNLRDNADVVVREGDISIAGAQERRLLPQVVTAGRPLLITGELTQAHRDELAGIFAVSQARFAEPLASPDRALGVADIARYRLEHDQADNRLALEPAYVRRPNITASKRHIIPGNQQAPAGNAS
jgi:tRNA threonylcarbamoyladenosine biosynthesis protein TsaB